METKNRTHALATLFAGAARAHHHAFEAVDGADAEWPIWYAEHLHPNVAALIGGDLTLSELVHFLVAADRLHRATAPDEPFPAFYARYMLGAYAAERGEAGEAG